MNIELRSDYPVTNEACQAATGKTFDQWSADLKGRPELEGKRRDGINWLADQIGRSVEQFWWCTTIWVEHEKRIGKVAKDGRAEGYGICSTKTIAAPVDKVQNALAAISGEVSRIREGKDIRAKWRSNGSDDESEIETMFVSNNGKTGVTLNHKRIQSREEADGLRRHWSTTLDALKKELEA
jgi:hypothetical protein